MRCKFHGLSLFAAIEEKNTNEGRGFPKWELFA